MKIANVLPKRSGPVTRMVLIFIRENRCVNIEIYLVRFARCMAIIPQGDNALIQHPNVCQANAQKQPLVTTTCDCLDLVNSVVCNSDPLIINLSKTYEC